jgi:hypothetical protein
MTPALANSRTAACVMEVPVPSNTMVVLAMGMFQYSDSWPVQLTIISLTK